MKILIIFLAIVTVSITGGFLITKSQSQPENTSSENIAEEDTFKIRGSLTYPSETIPKDIKVCAQNTKTESVSCTEDLIESNDFKFQIGYELELSSGTYHVYAHQGDNKAFYNSYVKGFANSGSWSDYSQDSCDKYRPIIVDAGNYDNEDIIVGDWYYQNYCSD